MAVAVLTIQIELPGCRSLKEKRARLKPLLARLHREFNISAAELAAQDDWDKAIIGCALISNDRQFSASAIQSVLHWLENNWPDVSVVDDQVEIIAKEG
jgi:uncharacterized protein YlxP (DUF503 family)